MIKCRRANRVITRTSEVLADMEIIAISQPLIKSGHSNLVPPIYMDERTYFNPRKNKSFSYADTIRFLAFKNARPAGRIMGIINRRYNESHGLSHTRLSFLECWEDPEVAAALLQERD